MQSRPLPIVLDVIGPSGELYQTLGKLARGQLFKLLKAAEVPVASNSIHQGYSSSQLGLVLMIHPAGDKPTDSVAVSATLRLREPICVEKHVKRCSETFLATTWEKQALWLTTVEQVKKSTVDHVSALACAFAEFSDCHVPLDLLCDTDDTVLRDFIGSGQKPPKYNSKESSLILQREGQTNGGEVRPIAPRARPLVNPNAKILPGQPADDSGFPGQPIDQNGYGTGDDNKQLFIQEINGGQQGGGN